MISKAIIIEARTNSKRFPNKTIKEICGKPTIQLLIERVKTLTEINHIVLATTKNSCDDQLIKIAENEKIKYFRGSEDDVLGRILSAASFFKIDQIISVPGDCPLIDPGCIKNVVKLFNDFSYDYASSALSETYPMGMETQVFWTKTLMKVDKLTKRPEDREHATQFIYNNPNLFKILKVKAPKNHTRPNYCLVLDEPEDFQLIKKIYEEFYEKKKFFSLDDIIFYLDQNPELLKINSKISRSDVSRGVPKK